MPTRRNVPKPPARAIRIGSRILKSAPAAAPPPPPAGSPPGGLIINRRPTRSFYGGIAAYRNTPPVAGVAGQQPHGFMSSRRPGRFLFGGVLSPPLPSPPGTAPDHLVVARRAAARVVWRGTVARTTNAVADAVTGTTPDHLVVARRAAARVVWRGFISHTTNLLYGNQPGAGAVKRRTAARAVWHGQPVPPLVARTQTGGLIRRRNGARGVWRGFVSATVNAAPSTPGVAVPPVHLVVARRATARAVWRPTSTRTTNLYSGNEPGGVVYRRRPARGVYSGRAVAPQQPRAETGGFTRARLHARAVWTGTVTRTVNATPATPVSGTAPDHLVIARRVAARVVWTGMVTRTTNAPPPVSGTAPGHLVIARRQAARAVWRGNPVPPRTGKPGTGGLVRRRKGTRAVTYWLPVRTTNALLPPVRKAASSPTVTDPRDGAVSLTAARTSTTAVTARAASSPAVSDA